MNGAFAHALTLHQHGCGDEAAALYRQILADDPTHAGAWHLLGIYLQSQGHVEQACEHLGFKPCLPGCGAETIEGVTFDANRSNGNIGMRDHWTNVANFGFAGTTAAEICYLPNLSDDNSNPLVEIEFDVTTFDGSGETIYGPITYDADDAKTQTTYNLLNHVDASGHGTGLYSWEATITEYFDDDGTTIAGDPITVSGGSAVFDSTGSQVATDSFVFGIPQLLSIGGSDMMLMDEGVQPFYYVDNEYVAGPATRTDANSLEELTSDPNYQWKLDSQKHGTRYFDSDGIILKTVGPKGKETTYSWDDVDSDGTYDRIASITTSEGTTTYSYTTYGQNNTSVIDTVTDEQGRVTTYTHDANGHLTKITRPDPDGAGPLPAPVITLTYDQDGELVALSDGVGAKASVTRDDTGRVESFTYPDGTTEEFESRMASGYPDIDWTTSQGREELASLVPSSGLANTATDALGNTTTTKVGTWGFATEVTDAEGNVTTYERNAFGQVTKKTEADPDGDGPLTESVTHYEYDSRQNLVRMVLPNGLERRWTYDDEFCVPTRYLDELGNTTIYYIDDAGNTVGERQVVNGEDGPGTDQDDLVTRSSYSGQTEERPSNQLVATRDPAAYTTGHAYDAAGRRIESFEYPNPDEISTETYSSGQWQFTGLTSGNRYQLFASWTKDENNTDQAEYAIFDGSAGGTAETITTVDQQDEDPVGHVVGGSDYQAIGALTPSGSTITVTLSLASGASGNLDTDSMKLVKIRTTSQSVHDPATDHLVARADAGGAWTEYQYDALGRRTRTFGPFPDTQTPSATTIDDAASDTGGFSKTGTWTEVTGSGHDSDYRYATGTSNAAEWAFASLDSSKAYEVLVTFVGDDTNNTSSAPYAVYDGTTSGGTLLDTQYVDQTRAPSGGQVFGGGWHSLGAFSISGSTLTVELSGVANDRVVADAVKLVDATRSITETAYDLADQVVQRTDATGLIRGTGYDPRGRAIESFYYPEPTSIDSVSYASGDWDVTELTSGKRYEIFVDWSEGSAKADTAVYDIYQGASAAGTPAVTTTVDQRKPSVGAPVVGTTYRSLGRVTAGGSELTITLSLGTGGSGTLDYGTVKVIEIQTQSTSTYDDAGRLVLSGDAEGNLTEYEHDNNGRVVKTYTPYPDYAGRTIEDETVTYQMSQVQDSDAVDGDYWKTTTQTNSSYAAYLFNELTPNTPYELWFTWPADDATLTDSTVTVSDGIYYQLSPTLDSFTLDQSAGPDGSPIHGEQWHYLGTYTPSDEVLSVKVSGGTGLVADAAMALEARAATETVYDSAGRRGKTIDAYGQETTYTYDGQDRVIQTTRPDPDGDDTDQSAPVTKTYYDSAGRVRGREDALGHGTGSVLDEAGHTTQSLFYADLTGTTIDDEDTGGGGFSTSGTWTTDTSTGSGYGDSRTRIQADSSGGSNTAEWSFGNLLAETTYELLATWTPYEAYDANDVLTDQSAEDATFTVYKDSVSSQNELGATTVNQTLQPIGDCVLGVGWASLGRFTLEAAGSLIVQLTDAATEGTTSGADRWVLADAIRLLEPETQTVYMYNDLGQLEHVQDAEENITGYTYDTRGRQVQVTQPDPDGTGGDLVAPERYTHYDQAGRMSATITPDLAVQTVEYDGAGRTVATYSGVLADYDHDQAGATVTGEVDRVAETGTWSDGSAEGGLFGGYRTAATTDQGTPDATVEWTFDGLVEGADYDVYMTWVDTADNVNDVPVAIFEGSTGGSATWSGTVDQTSEPSQASGFRPISDRPFTQLGSSVTLSDTTLIVQMGNDTGETGQVIVADGVYVVRADASSETTFNAAGQVTGSTDALGNETTYGYDLIGRRTTVTQPDPDSTGSDYAAPVTRTHYTVGGQVAGSVGADGRVETYDYDAQGRQTASYTGEVVTTADRLYGDDRYAEPSGSWSDSSSGLFDASRTTSTVTGSADSTATWTFDGLAVGGAYEVYVTWTADTGNAADARYQVYAGSTSGRLLAEADLDQTVAPSTPSEFRAFAEAPLERLATVELHADDAGTLVVQLSNDSATSGDTLVADGVYVVRKSPMAQKVFDHGGRLVATVDALGERTEFTYDHLGQQIEVVAPDADGDGPLTPERSQTRYDANGQVTEQIAYAGAPLEFDQREPYFTRVLDETVDIGAHEGYVGPDETAASPSGYTIYTVDSLADENDGDYSAGDFTLREALDRAESENSTYDAIDLTGLSGTIELDAVTYNRLLVDSDVAIIGPGAGSLTLDANGSSSNGNRIFAAGSGVNLIVSGVTLTGGYASYGGAVGVGDGSNLAFYDCTFTGNEATASGGAIYADVNDSIIVGGCTFTDNTAVASGGAAMIRCDRAFFYDSTFSGNTARTAGGAIALQYQSLDMVDCTVSGNAFRSDSETRYGAGLYLAGDANARIARTTVTNNRGEAVTGGYDAVHGGGIYAAGVGTDLTIDASTITENEATSYGGGLYARTGQFQLDATRLENNTAGTYGGGVFFHGGDTTITNSLVCGNTAGTSGGGLLITQSGEVELIGTTIGENTATSNYGGGLFIYNNASATLENCTIVDNTADRNGGGLSVAATGTRMDHTIVYDNTAVSDGNEDVYGTVAFEAASANNALGVVNATVGISDGVRGNLVGTDPQLGSLAHNGGPLKTYAPSSSSSPVVDAGDATYTDRYTDGRGEGFLRNVGAAPDIGAVEYSDSTQANHTLVVTSLADSGSGTLRDAVTSANDTPGHQFITFSGTLDLSAASDINLTSQIAITGDVTIIGAGADELTVDAGGNDRLFEIDDATVKFSGLTLTGGDADTGLGGAIHADGVDLTLHQVAITSNTADRAGGVHLSDGHLAVVDSTFSGNTATQHAGALDVQDVSEAILTQCTFSGNDAGSGYGGAILLSSTVGHASLTQCTVTGNEANSYGGGVYAAASNTTVYLQNTILADNNTSGDNRDDVSGAVGSDSSYNLIGSGEGLSGISDGSQGNQIGSSGSPLAPQLAALADNGGPTQTHAPRVGSPVINAGDNDQAVTGAGRRTELEYDDHGRVTKRIDPDPDGIGPVEAPETEYSYDPVGRRTKTTEPDPDGDGDEPRAVTEYSYDGLGRKIETKGPDPDGDEEPKTSPITTYTYDAAGRRTGLTDPEENTTQWTYGAHGQVITETITVSSSPLSRTFEYDAAGQLSRRIDRNGRVIDTTRDDLLRQTGETWYNNVTDADAAQNVVATITTKYDEGSRVAELDDGSTVLGSSYSVFGTLLETTQDLGGLSDTVTQTHGYDAAGRRQSTAVELGTTDDYVNRYAYDQVGRLTRATQAGQTGGNTVAAKRVDLVYGRDGLSTHMDRYADLAGADYVTGTDTVFDQLGRTTDLTHRRADTVFADYDLEWDAAGRITDLDFDFLGSGSDDQADYTYDGTSQLENADYISQSDESYAYDDNGNRTLVDGTDSYTTDDHNRMTSDGTYAYEYDNEGNRTRKYIASGDVDVEKYEWDHHNRLVKVELYDSGTLDQVVEYAYDPNGKLYKRTLDSDADGTVDTQSVFVRADDQIALELEKSGTGNLSAGDLETRQLWLPQSVDHHLAQEEISSGDLFWSLPDHLNTVRDVVEYVSGSDSTVLKNHIDYDAFGRILAQSDANVVTVAYYTGRYRDLVTGLQYNRARWYDAHTGRWLSEDPIGFEGGDGNLYRYGGNFAVVVQDPSGLRWIVCKCFYSGQGQVGGGIGYEKWANCVGSTGETCCRKACLPASYQGWRLPNLPPIARPPNFIPNKKVPFVGWYEIGSPSTRASLIARAGKLALKPVPAGPPTPAKFGKKSGSYAVLPLPVPPPAPARRHSHIGAAACKTCIGVVVACRDRVATFHFSSSCNAKKTLREHEWSPGCRAVICGGDTNKGSRCQLQEVIGTLNSLPVILDGMFDSSQCYRGHDGKWYSK